MVTRLVTLHTSLTATSTEPLPTPGGEVALRLPRHERDAVLGPTASGPQRLDAPPSQRWLR